VAKKTLIVSGALANKPFNGGNAWTRLSWACGFRRLGYKVVFVERLSGGASDAGVDYFRRVMGDFGFADSAALLDERGERVVAGMAADRVFDAAASAEMLFNISGHCDVGRLKGGPRLRVYFDDDPGYTQFWHAAGEAGPRLGGHDFYYTVGLNVGAPGCSIPSSGIGWRHTKPPVVLEQWPPVPVEAAGPLGLRFTTVASWRGPYGPVTFGGRPYGLKAHEFRKVIDLPRRAGQTFEIALEIHPGDAKDLAALRDHGWLVTDPRAASGTPELFRRYVQGSSAEFSCAQGVYVDTHSGWFSDRTTRYLASARPALVQDTGFGRHVQCGEGLVAFRTPAEAAAGAGRIARDYPTHCAAARAVAESCFDSDVVLARLLDEVGARG
jgi:hypothetical protein